MKRTSLSYHVLLYLHIHVHYMLHPEVKRKYNQIYMQHYKEFKYSIIIKNNLSISQYDIRNIHPLA